MGCGSGTLLADAIDGGVDAFVPSPPDAELVDGATAVDARTIDSACDGGVARWSMTGHDARRTSRSTVKGPRTNHVRWTYPMVNFGSSPAIAADGTVYVTTQGGPGTLLALNSNGTLLWSVPNVGSYASPTIAPDGTIYLDGYGAYDPNQFNFPADIMVAVDAKGTRKWAYGDYSRISKSDNAPTPGLGDLMLASAQGIYGIHPDGSVAFHLGKSGGGGKANGDNGTSRVAISAGVAYAGIGDLDSAEGGTFAIVADGSTVWKMAGVREGLIANDGTFYSTGGAGVDAISPAGAVLWHLDLDVRTPLAEGPSGTLYLRTGDGIVSIDPKAPKAKLVYALASPSMGNQSPLVIDAEGYVFFYAYPQVIVLDPLGVVAFTVDLSADGSVTQVDYAALALGDCVLYVPAFEHLVAIGL